MKLYQTILVQSWQTAIHHPSRWVFGLFAALLVGNGGEIDRYLRYLDAFAQHQGLINVLFWSQQPWFQALKQALPQINPVWLVSIASLAMFLVIYMVTIAQGSLILGATIKPTTKVVPFAELFNSSQKHVLALFILNVVNYLIIALTVLGCSKLSFGLAAVVLLPVIMIVSLVSKYAANYIVLENNHLGTALVQGWILLWRNFRKTLLMALVVFGLAVIINLGIVLAVGVVLAPFFSSLPLDLYTINTIGVIVYAIAVIVIGAIVSTWQWTAWTLLFKELTVGSTIATPLHRSK